VKHRLRRAVVALALASAAVFTVTGLAAAPQSDTAWGAPDTTDDTAWGTPPVDPPVELPPITPFDTAWG
jgi:hypothetical protein